MGEPGWINRSIFAGIRPFVSHWPWWNLAAVLVELFIGSMLVWGRAIRPVLGLSIAWALVIWWLGEGFGLLPTGFALMEAGAPGTAIGYVALVLLSWPRTGRPDVGRRAWMAAWMVIWVGGAVLHLISPFPARQLLTANLATLAEGSPSWLMGASAPVLHLARHHGVALNLALATLDLLVGLGALREGPFRRIWIAVGLAAAIFFWVSFQQLGGIFTAGATDPGLGPLVVIIGLAGLGSLRWERTKNGGSSAPEAKITS